jgi:CelD/BcsL family acetyltransferase involved in cellulose biosynthesis
VSARPCATARAVEPAETPSIGVLVAGSGAGPEPPSARLDVRVVRGIEPIRLLEKDWCALFERVPDASFYVSPEWLIPFFERESARGGLLAIGAWTGDRLVGLLLLSVRRSLGVRLAQPLGTVRPGVYGALIDPEAGAAAGHVAQACTERALFDVLALHDVSGEDRMTAELVAALAARGWAVRRLPRTLVRCVELPGDFGAYLAGRSAKQRQAIRRHARRLAEHGAVGVDVFDGPEIRSDELDRAVRIQEESWMRRRGAVALNQPFYRELYLAAARGGLARMWFLTVDGDDAAFRLGIRRRDTLYAQFTAFKEKYAPLRVGHVLTERMVRDCCERGVRRIDFGQGDGEHKRFWGTGSYGVERVFVGRGWRGRIAAQVQAGLWKLAGNAAFRRWKTQVTRFLIRMRGGRAAGSEAGD